MVRLEEVFIVEEVFLTLYELSGDKASNSNGLFYFFGSIVMNFVT